MVRNPAYGLPQKIFDGTYTGITGIKSTDPTTTKVNTEAENKVVKLAMNDATRMKELSFDMVKGYFLAAGNRVQCEGASKICQSIGGITTKCGSITLTETKASG